MSKCLTIIVFFISFINENISQDSTGYKRDITFDFTDNFNLRNQTSYFGPNYGISSTSKWNAKFRYGIGINFSPHNQLFKNVLGFNSNIKFYPFGFTRKINSYAIFSQFLMAKKVKNQEIIKLNEYSLVIINPSLFRLTKMKVGLGYGLDISLTPRMFLSFSTRINWEYGQYEWNYTGNFEDNYYHEYNEAVIDATLSIGYYFN